MESGNANSARVAFFSHNGFARCTPEVESAVRACAAFLARVGCRVEEQTPPGVEQAYELELALLGADGAEGIDRYLKEVGSTQVHPLLTGFLDHMRPYRACGPELAKRWAQWDEYRASLARFFRQYDAILCPVYTQPAIEHCGSLDESNFQGFSYTMAWNVAGFPAATVRCAEHNGLPISVQVVTRPWRDLLAIEICRRIEAEFGGWQVPLRLRS